MIIDYLMRLYMVSDLRLELIAHRGEISVMGFPDISRLVIVLDNSRQSLPNLQRKHIHYINDQWKKSCAKTNQDMRLHLQTFEFLDSGKKNLRHMTVNK